MGSIKSSAFNRAMHSIRASVRTCCFLFRILPPHPSFMYATLRPSQRALVQGRDGAFHEFTPPPPPPMFDNGNPPEGVAVVMGPPPVPQCPEEAKAMLLAEKKKRESSV